MCILLSIVIAENATQTGHIFIDDSGIDRIMIKTVKIEHYCMKVRYLLFAIATLM